MESRAKLAGHPIHQMLIVFPLGLLATSIVFDLVALIANNARWAEIAYYMIGAGIVGGLVSVPFGWIDWIAIPQGTRAKRIGLLHGVGNVIVLGLFIVSWLLRRDGIAEPPTEAVVASLAGGALAVVTGWLGGELVDRLSVGVHDGAHLDAPSSLSRLPAGSTLGRAAGMMHWSGVERRINPVPAYAGMERRHANLR